jgi:hypothetical protein
MNSYLALITLFFLGQVISVDSFMPVNSRHCSRDSCGLDKYIEPTPKLKKIIKDLMKKTEKIKNILIYPEPDDKEDWESGEIPWEPRNVNETEIYEVNNGTSSNDEQDSLSSYNLGMLFI